MSAFLHCFIVENASLFFTNDNNAKTVSTTNDKHAWAAQAHEFAHALQGATLGRSVQSWIVESHAEFMRNAYAGEFSNFHQLPRASHIAYGSSRNRYGNYHFLNYLAAKHCPGLVSQIWANAAKFIPAGSSTFDPLLVLKGVTGWSQATLGNEWLKVRNQS